MEVIVIDSSAYAKLKLDLKQIVQQAIIDAKFEKMERNKITINT